MPFGLKVLWHVPDVPGAARSIVVGLVAATVLGASALPAMTHQRAAAEQECAGHGAGPERQAPDQSPLGCDHAPGSNCATMLGCVATAPALAVALARVTGGPVVGTLGPTSSPSVHGRLALGPPPPPPNS